MIRKATNHDTTALAKLCHLAIGDIAHQLTGTTDDKEALERIAAFINREGNRFSSSLFLVKEIDDYPVGMILCYPGSEASSLYAPIAEELRKWSPGITAVIDKEADVDEYYIDALAVSSFYQGRGYATELIRAAEARARMDRYSNIALNVDKANTKAHALYKRLGYKTNKEMMIHNKPFWHMVKQVK